MKYKNYIILLDTILIVLALLISFSVSLEYFYLPESEFIWIVYGSPIISIPIYKVFGLYRHIPAYFNSKIFFIIVKSSLLYILILSSIILAFQPNSGTDGFDTMPRSAFFINFILSIVFISGHRFFLSLFSNKKSESGVYRFKNKALKADFKNIYIYGVGPESLQLVRTFQNLDSYKLLGLVTDLKDFHNHILMDIEIYPVDGINKQIKVDNVKEILIPESLIDHDLGVIDKLRLTSLAIRTMPDLDQFNSLMQKEDKLKDLSNFDLLGRKTAQIDIESIDKHINGKAIMVTGAGGTIGSELCQQILSFNPHTLILFEISEVLLYESYQNILNSIMKKSIDIRIIPLLGSVTNKARLTKVIKRYEVNIIYHAAAYKHVPIVEHNIIEGVNNNILGTLYCAQAAIECKVNEFILVSTDKAVRPSSVMGATKRVAELILQTLSSEQNKTKFSIVRFGNVLDSSGSVVPLFRKQISAGGPITVTDKKMIRYFMLLQEAVGLIMQAGIMGQGGEVFVLDMGKPVKIDSLAKNMIKLSGKKLRDDSHPSGDIEIQYIGLRPGEKLYEELVIGGSLSKTAHNLIMSSNEDKLENDELYRILELLKTSCADYDFHEALKLLTQAVDNYIPHSKIVDYGQ